MLSKQDQTIARTFRQRLTALMPVLDVCVFGSRARGDAAEDSDLDVFIEVEELTPNLREQIFDVAWEVGFEVERVISTIVATRNEIEHGAIGANPLLRNIEREGIHV